MLLIAKRQRMALGVAALPLLGALGLVALALESRASNLGLRARAAALLGGAMLLFVAFTATTVRARAHTLVVRSLSAKQTFDARAAAFGVSAVRSARGIAHTVYVTDGMRRSDLGVDFPGRALASARALTAAFAVANRGGSAEARGLVAREIGRWQGQPAGARRPLVVAAAVVTYGAVMTALVSLDR
jgi:hypothetical protein